MQKTKPPLKTHYGLVVLMVIAGSFVFCGSVQAQIQSEQVLNQLRPEVRTQLQNLQREIEEKGYTFTVGYSPAMEYGISQLCGLVEPKDWRSSVPFERMESYLATVPVSYDTRSDLPDGNTTVRNQGQCGSCWAFGTVGPLEILISAICGVKVDLSEQYLVSCNESGWSCSGGWFAHEYHQSHVPTSKGETEAGAVLETTFPYKASNVSCNSPSSPTPHNPHPYKINGWAVVAGYGVPTVPAIKQAIYNYGPVSAAVCVGNAFQSYRSGVFNANETCSGNVNHAVTLVGWNDDLGTDNGYWILKNSWGKGWGENGYMRIRYGISKVGYAANFIDFSKCAGSPVAGLNCANAASIATLPAALSGTTVGNESNVGTYNLGRTLNGPEKVFQVKTTQAGDLTATLSSLTADLDVFILSACNANSAVAYGNDSAKYVNAPAGTYYIVVDGYSGASGSFTLQTTLANALPDLTGGWMQISSYNSSRIVYGTLKVNNIGSANAASFKVAYYLSNDGSTLGSRLGTQTATAGLNAGKSLYLYPRFTSSSSLKGRYLVAVIDYDAKITESNENNNTAVGGSIKARVR